MRSHDMVNDDPFLSFCLVDIQNELGIMPMLSKDERMKEHIASLKNPEDEMRLKRKFRKIWRKLLKSLKSDNTAFSKIQKIQYGIGKLNPSPTQMNNRRALVFYEMLKRAQAKSRSHR